MNEVVSTIAVPQRGRELLSLIQEQKILHLHRIDMSGTRWVIVFNKSKNCFTEACVKFRVTPDNTKVEGR